jgi:predicted RNA-binding protein with PUA-like domain
MAYWLLKSEPDAFSWQEMTTRHRDCWDGIRNYQARNNLKAMQRKDVCLFYHSNIGKEIVGLVQVVKTYYPDPTVVETPNPWVVVDVEVIKPLRVPVTLEQLKANPLLADLSLIKQSRLSVCPVKDAEFEVILRMSQTTVR